MKYVSVAVTIQPLTNVALIRQKINSSLRQNYSLMCLGGQGGGRYKSDSSGLYNIMCCAQGALKYARSVIGSGNGLWDVLENN
jgi:hypothetical protein